MGWGGAQRMGGRGAAGRRSRSPAAAGGRVAFCFFFVFFLNLFLFLGFLFKPGKKMIVVYFSIRPKISACLDWYN